MVIWLCLRWWYGAGWQWAWQRTVIDRLRWAMETFSVKALLRTLFAPYRQTFSGGTGKSVQAFFQTLLDNSISRGVGFGVRLCLLLAGSVFSLVVFGVGILTLALWAFIPLMPLIGLILLGTGWAA